MTIGDELLMAYIDGETNAEETRRIETAMASDAALQARVEKQQRLGRELRDAFPPSDAVPAQLRTIAMTAPVSWQWRLREAVHSVLTAGQRGGGTISLSRFAMTAAAALVLGLVAGRALLPAADDTGLAGSGIVARGELANVLDTRLASDAGAGPRLGVSFRNRAGENCRTFVAADKAGLACRSGDTWLIAALADAPQASGDFHAAAAAMPDAIRAAVNSMIDGEPFDAAQERAARERGWRR